MGQLLLSQILERPWLQNSELKRPSSRWNVSNEICLGGVLLYLSASGASHRKVHRWFFSVLKAYIQNIPTLVNVSSHLTGGAYKGLVRWGQCWRTEARSLTGSAGEVFPFVRHAVLSLRAGFPHTLLSHTQLPALPQMSHFFFIPWEKLLSLSETFQLLSLFAPFPLCGTLLTHPFHLRWHRASSCSCKIQLSLCLAPLEAESLFRCGSQFLFIITSLMPIIVSETLKAFAECWMAKWKKSYHLTWQSMSYFFKPHSKPLQSRLCAF